MQQPGAVAVPMPQSAAVAVPMQQPATSVMVTCPPGMKPGDTLQVAGPDGHVQMVQVPPGVFAGGQFMVQMQTPVVMAQAPPQVAMAVPVQSAPPNAMLMALPVQA